MYSQESQNLISLLYVIAGRVQCAQDPTPVRVEMVRSVMAGNVTFDEEYQVVLDDLTEQYGAQYPPPTIEDADRLYLQLRAEMRARQD